MRYGKPPRPIDELHQRELNVLRRVVAHRELAVAAAIHYCAEYGVCPPQWVVTEAGELLCDLLKRERAQKRGRSAGHVARYRQALWEIERWDAVVQIRRYRDTCKRDLQLIKDYPETFGDDPRVPSVKKRGAWFRKYGTYRCASMYLAGRDARAGADAIRASCRKVERRSRSSQTATQHHLFHESFLLKLGFPSLQERKPGSKYFPLEALIP